jgi:hypothetical protein
MPVTENTSALMQSEACLGSSPVPGPALYEAALLISLFGSDPCIPDDATNWKALEDMARENGVLVLAFRALVEAGAEVPDAFAQSAKASEAAAAQHAMELRHLLMEFGRQKIDVLPLKGPALSLRLYDDATLRQSNDLDLLVRSKDFARAEAILMERGFLPRGQHRAYDRRFLRDDLMVELHFQLSPSRSFPFRTEDVWRRAVKTGFLDAPAYMMSREDLVLYLCWHGLKHGFCRLIWILDLARALRGWRSEEYKSLFDHARQKDLMPWLLTGCEVVRTMLPLEMPEELDAVVAASPMLENARRTASRVFTVGPAKEITDYRCFYLQTGKNRLKRWRYRASLLLNVFESTPAGSERSGLRISYRSVANLRPFRALRKYGVRRACRMLFPSRE